MKSERKRLLVVISFCLFFITIAVAQNIINKLGGNDSSVEFQVTDSEDNVKFYVKGNGDTGINGNISVSGTGMWNHSGAVVYDNLSGPTNWTDLDLSSVVGANYAFVLLKVKNWSESSKLNIYFRPDGDSDSYSNEGFEYPSGAHVASLRQGPGYSGLVICETASNGYVEWKGGGVNVSVWVLGYIK